MEAINHFIEPRYTVDELKEIKKETLEHWDKLIKYAEEHKDLVVNPYIMEDDIGENWFGDSCPLCQEAKSKCEDYYFYLRNPEEDIEFSDCHFCLYAYYLALSGEIPCSCEIDDCEFCACGDDTKDYWSKVEAVHKRSFNDTYEYWLAPARLFRKVLEEMFNFYIFRACDLKEGEDNVRY